MNVHHIGQRREHAHGRKIPDRIVWQFRHEIGIDGKPGGTADQQRVTVGRGPRPPFSRDDAAGAGTIVDRYMLPQQLGQRLA